MYVYDPNLETTVYVNNTSSIINLKKLPNSGVKDISVNQHAVAENEKSDKKNDISNGFNENSINKGVD